MSYIKLPQRVFNSPLIEYANFEDGSFVNLIRLIKPYADGTSYAVYETTRCAFCSNGLFKTYEEAKKKFELMVRNGSTESKLVERGLTGNIMKAKCISLTETIVPLWKEYFTIGKTYAVNRIDESDGTMRVFDNFGYAMWVDASCFEIENIDGQIENQTEL